MKHTLTTREFNKLSRPKRAVLVAKDVISQIKSGILKVKHIYCAVKISKNTSPEADAATIFRQKKASCQACARGALFLSAVKFKNVLQICDISNQNFSYRDNNDTYNTNNHTVYLSEEFDRKQQALIETAYEGRVYGRLDDFKSVDEYDAQIDRSLKFNEVVLSKYKKLPKPRTYKKDAYLLITICKNIIKNNGTFKP